MTPDEAERFVDAFDDAGAELKTGGPRAENAWRETRRKLIDALIETSAQTSPQTVDAAKEIRRVCDEVCEMLLAKNRAYGNSALQPLRIFSKAPASAQIRTRIDDKLSRISNGDTSEDAVLDLIGYLILLRISEATPKCVNN